jgi:hypothetical protein
MKTQSGSTGIAPPIHNLNAIGRGVDIERHSPASLPLTMTRVLGSGPVWTGTQNFATSGLRTPKLPAHVESLYRLSYLRPQWPTEEPYVAKLLENELEAAKGMAHNLKIYY